MWLGGSPCSGLHHIQTRYEKFGNEEDGVTNDEEDMSQMEEHELYSGSIIKIGARCFFLQSRGPL